MIHLMAHMAHMAHNGTYLPRRGEPAPTCPGLPWEPSRMGPALRAVERGMSRAAKQPPPKRGHGNFPDEENPIRIGVPRVEDICLT
jgi:hypothetical protein